MIEYRKLPKGDERISTLGLGMGGIQAAGADQIKAVVEKAVANGINFFDLCAGGAAVYEPFGTAIKGIREKVYFQLHFGAVYNKKGEYGWSRKLEEVKSTFEWEMKCIGTDYVDFGFLHCVDSDGDIDDLKSSGITDFLFGLKEKGVVRHLGFSSHTPSVAQKLIDMGFADMMMFSLNPAYDFEQGDEYGRGSTSERAELLKRCQAEGIGISVMKPFHGGQLLSQSTSPFKAALSKNQCMKYALDRPAVLTVVPGVRSMSDLDELLEFAHTTPEQEDYSVIAKFTSSSSAGNCVYCNHCLPCPAGIDIGLVNKYYDLSLSGDKMAHDHYGKLKTNAEACISCGHCDRRCPFSVKQSERMKKISDYFKGDKNNA